MASTEEIVRRALSPQRLTAVYNLAFPYAKGRSPSGTSAGEYRFQPSKEYLQNFYDLIFHDALLPLSRIPLEILLEYDLTKHLPDTAAVDYPEQCLGMVTILDQQRMILAGYGKRYMRAFFDPICEKLGRQLISLPPQLRPDGQVAWLSRGYTIEDWLVRTLWFWGPLIHSDVFMVQDRDVAKDWLHSVRAEVEKYSGRRDPFAACEAEDDVDLTIFGRIFAAGVPKESYTGSGQEADVTDYAFWWIRLLNAHFAITDFAGHYSFWTRWKGEAFTENDRHYLRVDSMLADGPEAEEVLGEIYEDRIAGRWQALPPNLDYERSRE